MTLTQEIITIAAAVLGTMATRFLLFLGRLLPPAVMGMLVVYSLKDVQFTGGTHGVPEALAIALLVALQLTLRNALVTIGVSTVFYMLLVQKIFV